MAKSTEPKDQKCSECGQMFGKRGLPGHLAMVHGITRKPNERKDATPAAGKNGDELLEERPAPERDRNPDELDDFLFG